MKKKLIVGISGASGVIYGIRLLEILQNIPTIETHLILSTAAAQNIEIETTYDVQQVLRLADIAYAPHEMTAAIASGSSLTAGMVVVPCSIKTLSGIANSYNDNLLTRAADVMLKEGQPLIVVPRETPLHKGHLQLMLKLVDIGGILIPPIPAFYHQPKTIGEIIDHTLGKILDRLQIEHALFQRWEGLSDGSLA